MNKMIKRKKFTLGFTTFLLVSTLLFGFATTPVLADSVISLDDGWEDEIIGHHNGTSGYFDYEINSADMKLAWWQIDNTHALDTRSFYVKKDYDATTSVIGWWNLTHSFDYISQFEFRFYLDDIGSAGWLYFYFFNTTGNVLKIRFDIGGQDIDYYDVVTGWSELSASWISYDDQFAKFTFTHIDTNIMNYSIFNSVGTLIDSVEDATAFSSTWTSFTGIAIGHSGGGASDELYMWFDNFNITSGSAGQEEGEGASGSDYSRCSYSYEGTIDLDEPYIEGYIDSFGDVTINAVDLFVSTGQYNYVGSNKSKYVGYLNGVSIGNPDYFFQDSSTEYVLRWEFSGIDIGTYDISLEFSQVDLAYGTNEIHWLNLPMNDEYILGSTYHSTALKFGDGSVYGVPFSTSNPDMGFKYCLYYDKNVDSSSNTYALTILSVDPHTQGNITTINVDVTGSDDYWTIFSDPSGNVVDLKSHLGSSNGDSVVSYNLPPDAETGTWTFYACDKDLFVYPISNWNDLDTYGTNVTFTVSSGSFDSWDIYAYDENCVLGDSNGFYVLGVLNQNFTVVISEPDGSYTDFVGIGKGSTLISSGWIIDCNTVGTYHLALYNGTRPNIWWQKGVIFTVTENEEQNYLTVLGDNTVCAGNAITLQGSYLSNVGSIEISFGNEYDFSIGIGLGVFSKAFLTPNDAFGEWIAYLADADGNKIDGTTLTFTSEDCSDDSTTGAIGELNALIGVFMVIAVAIGLLIITGEPIAFVGGGCASAFIFAQPTLGAYQLLPVEVGYGLIVILVLVALIAWLAN